MASPQAIPGAPGPPTSISDQIDRLRQRGMSIPHQDAAIRLLSNIGLYRFRGYLEPFVDDTTASEPRPFKAGTTFAEVAERHFFDTRLRVLLLEAFSHIEISVRTQWTYHLSYSEGGGEYAHLNPLFFGGNHGDNLAFLEKDYEERSQDLHSSYVFRACPTWAVSEVMSFGQLSRWYGDTALPVKKKVAGHYQLHYRVLKSLLYNLSTVRNICAHHQRLWDREIATKFRLPKQLVGVSNSEALFNKAEPSKLYNTLVMMAYLTREIINDTTWAQSLVDLMDQFPNIPQTTLGFVPGWQELAIWQE